MMYGYSRIVDMSFDEATKKVNIELNELGYGIITAIDVQEIMKRKLDIDFKKYMILGACNPKFGHNAIEAEEEIGLMMPCNVIVYENDIGVHISTILPTVAMGMIENDKLKKIAEDTEKNLKAAINNV